MCQTGVKIWVISTNRIEKQGSPRFSILVRPIEKEGFTLLLKGMALKSYLLIKKNIVFN